MNSFCRTQVRDHTDLIVQGVGPQSFALTCTDSRLQLAVRGPGRS